MLRLGEESILDFFGFLDFLKKEIFSEKKAERKNFKVGFAENAERKIFKVGFAENAEWKIFKVGFAENTERKISKLDLRIFRK